MPVKVFVNTVYSPVSDKTPHVPGCHFCFNEFKQCTKQYSVAGMVETERKCFMLAQLHSRLVKQSCFVFFNFIKFLVKERYSNTNAPAVFTRQTNNFKSQDRGCTPWMGLVLYIVLGGGVPHCRPVCIQVPHDL